MNTKPHNEALPPGSTIGILGSGQLGRMLAISAAELGFTTHVYANDSGPAFDVASHTTEGAFDDLAAMEAFASAVDVVTYEFENVPVAAAEAAARIGPVRPSPRALAVAQDRLIEKSFIAELGLAVPRFAAVNDEASLAAAIETIGTPSILKTRRLGYDGKGQARISTATNAAEAFQAIGRQPAILEAQVDFAFEVSILVVRGLDGEIRYYDVPVNTHEDGILARSVVPAPLTPELTATVQDVGSRVAEAIDYVGVLAIELFCCRESQSPIIVNEIAPRVHNSGHWTQDACYASQFENHIRAIAGWPLASTRRHSDAEMVNLIGSTVDDWRRLAANLDVAVHIYGKREARPGRKMGHMTRLSHRANP